MDAGYLLNLNTGRALTPLASFDPGEGEGFWYPIDRDVTWQSGRALLGPAPREVFARVPYERLLPVVCASIEARTTGLEERDLLDNAVLNGCRALRFGAERRWYAKLAAAQRTLPAAGEFAPLVRAAMASFRSGRDGALVLPAEVVGAFLGEVLRRLR